MKLQTVSIFVDDQQRAVDFYTERLGFSVTADIPMGEHRWLTVVDPERPDATQISLEPKGHPATAPFTEHSKDWAKEPGTLPAGYLVFSLPDKK